MNLFDLPGPTFLGIWVMAAVGVGLVTLVLRSLLSGPRIGVSTRELDPSEVGYLEGDRERAIEAAVAGLVHRGVLATNGWGVTLTDPAPGSLNEVERYIVESARRGPVTVDSLVREAGNVEDSLRVRLASDGLVVAPTGWQRLWLRVPLVAWLALGSVKVTVGIARDRPVILLVLLLAVGGWLLARISLPRLTGRGRRTLDRVRKRSYGLEATAVTAPAQLAADELALSYALFGGVVLAGTLGTMMPSVQREALAATAATSSTSCGSGGGCGSSCGGGCGGCS